MIKTTLQLLLATLCGLALTLLAVFDQFAVLGYILTVICAAVCLFYRPRSE